MKSKLLALMLLAGGAAMAGPRLYFGFGFGAPAPVAVYAPPPAQVVTAYMPPAPGANYTWIAGYYAPYGARWTWRAGYWAPRPFVGARFVAPRYYGGHYYHGYWRR
ncbi:MAG TPA: hypothetical protein VHW24_09125 [Bryobacteraceae bacterium]|nr:hypothetical protein [Bryobacteraceae bacterium]